MVVVAAAVAVAPPKRLLFRGRRNGGDGQHHGDMAKTEMRVTTVTFYRGGGTQGALAKNAAEFGSGLKKVGEG